MQQLQAPACLPTLACARPSRRTAFHTIRSQQHEHSSTTDRTDTLRALLARPGILLGPACYDGLSARLIERAGFDFGFMSGFSVSAARLGAPDTGLLSYGEMVDAARCVAEAAPRLPIIGDGDTGYGNALNVRRTVGGYAAAGLAGVLIEDQQWPKQCGHVQGKRVVPRGEAVARIRAACDARDEGRSGIVVVARSDARQAESLSEALWRAAAFADAGADVVFIDALASADEMEALCRAVPGAHKMASMLEGGGKTPILTPQQLEAMGFKLCAYPLSLLGVSAAAMQVALAGLKEGAVPQAPAMPTFQELQALLDFPEYFAEADRYAAVAAAIDGASAGGGGSGGGVVMGGGASSTPAARASAAGSPPPAADGSSSGGSVGDGGGSIDADAVLEPGSSTSSSSSIASDTALPTGTIDLYSGAGGNGTSGGGGASQEGQQYGARDRRDAQWLRVRVSNARSGVTTLDTRFPAGWINSIATVIPSIAGVDLEGLVRQATGDATWESSQPIYRFDGADGERIEVFLEFS